MTTQVKQPKKMATFQIRPTQIHELSVLQEKLNGDLPSDQRVSKNDLIEQALTLLFKKHHDR